MSQQSDLEYLLRQEAQRQVMMWFWAVLGPVGLLILVVIVIMCGVVAALSGGNQYGLETYVGSAQALPSSWLQLVNQAEGSLSNEVILGDMELESGGQANSTNYNLSNGQASDLEPIGQPGVSILSVDAGLMQINSGYPPYWPARPHWDLVFGAGGDPYDPAKNIKAGVQELSDDTQQYGYLSEAFEAYNTGSGYNCNGYADKVLGNILAYEGGPEADEWAIGNYTGQSNSFLWWSWGPRKWVQPYQNAPTWILVAGSYAEPADNAQTILWAPPPEKGEPPVTYQWFPLEPPDKVTINGQPASLVTPPEAPVLQGQTVFGLQVTRPGTYTAACEWDWDTYVHHKDGSVTVIHHHKTCTAPSIEICARETVSPASHQQ